MILAEELIAPGGPSAPAWAFFTAITLALISLIGQQIAAKKQHKQESEALKQEASIARENSEKAAQNTVNISNGFVGRIDRKLDNLQDNVLKLMEWQRDHQEQHNREREN